MVSCLNSGPGTTEPGDVSRSSTNFFRDDTFDYLGHAVIPKIFADKGPGDTVRVWSVGCATGEETYSLAMLLVEYASRLAEGPVLRIFATDISQGAIADARKGRFPTAIAERLRPERLHRFFIKDGDHYQVKDELRQMVLFASHDVLRDPVFLHLDFIGCGNLFGCLSQDMQKRALLLFHFSLRPGGFLLLGASESGELTDELFSAADEERRLYRRQWSRATHPDLRLLAADWLVHTSELVHATWVEQDQTWSAKLSASNQQLRALNEELRTSAEELDSRREELRAVNDELTRVNRQYREKIEELRRVNADLSNLIGANDIATIFLDPTLRIKRFTPRAQTLFNITSNDLQRPLGDFTCHLDYPNLTTDAAQVLLDLRTIERECPANDGGWYLARLVPYRGIDDRIDGVVATFIDVTNRRLAEEALRQANHNKDHFLAALSHELRNPLAAILSSVQLLRLSGNRAEATAQACVILERQSNHLLRLVDDLLDVERLEHGKISLRKRLVRLSEVIDAALALCRPLLDSSSRHFSVVVPIQLVSIEADPERMTQVIINLVHNAFKYTPVGGSIELAAEIEHRELILRVCDNGIGIPPELLPRIFDMYSQGAAASHLDSRGLGVGLALVRKLVELHGGSVTAQSDGLQKGTTFVVRLPVVVTVELDESPTHHRFKHNAV